MAVNTDISLKQYLDQWADTDAENTAVSSTVLRVAAAAAMLTKTIACCSLSKFADSTGGENLDSVTEKSLAMKAHQLFGYELMSAPIAVVTSTECSEEIAVDAGASLGVAIDPLNASSTIDTNAPVGTLFSVFSIDEMQRPLRNQAFLGCDGNNQMAAGFILYGPQTLLVLTVRTGTQVFVLDPNWSMFFLVRKDVQIPESQREYSINASGQRFWDAAIRAYINDCMDGASGPLDGDFTMHWMDSLVAEVYRVLVRGGIFLCPRESRPGFEKGRVRLLYEAFPVALLVEQAGGAATDCEQRILDKSISDTQECVPLVLGSKDKVERVARYHANPPDEANQYPLFGQRKLLRT